MNDGGFPELLGFESHIPMYGGGDLPAAPPRAVAEREKLLKQQQQQQRQEGERKSLKSFPPLLTTLSKVDERPRFDLKKMTLENGRLVISMARNVDKTMILRCRTRDGRMLMWGVRPDCDSSDDDDDDLDHDEEFKNGFDKGSRIK